jgi:DNA (cytosine-5)-methyltransferase 1
MGMKRALDLFCKAGGATKGLQRAGYHVTGVDIEPQPHYCGDVFYQADAMTFDLSGYDLIWASPPCQLYSVLTPTEYKGNHSDLIAPIRDRLLQTNIPYIIENVAGARYKLRNPFLLCGSMFGLDFWRHRYFEIGNSDVFFLVPPCNHSFTPILISGRGMLKINGKRRSQEKIAVKRTAMQCDWMTDDEITEAIPPTYSYFLAMELQKYDQ